MGDVYHSLRALMTHTRKLLGLSQAQAAARCNPPISQETWGQRERGKYDLQPSTIKDVCRALGVEIAIRISHRSDVPTTFEVGYPEELLLRLEEDD